MRVNGLLMHSCGGVAMALNRIPVGGDKLMSADVAYTFNGNAVSGEQIRCVSCGSQLSHKDLLTSLIKEIDD